MSEIPGFELREFGKFAAQNPNDVLLVLEATTTWEGKGGESLAKIGLGNSPGSVLTSPSVNWAICINAVHEGLSLNELKVTAKARVDPRLLFGVVPVEEAASWVESPKEDSCRQSG